VERAQSEADDLPQKRAWQEPQGCQQDPQHPEISGIGVSDDTIDVLDTAQLFEGEELGVSRQIDVAHTHQGPYLQTSEVC